ncbi:MAG TPA: SRPBCC family protein [Candidatus Limnocylindria bacterium]|nr:SRPBCC family protein [Candidatus Limnocylindria bacterium]
MIKEEGNVIIRRPLEEVFAYVSDLTHSAEWQGGLLEVRKLTEGPIGVGTRYAFVRQFLGRQMESTNEFVAYEPDVTVRFKIPSGPMPGQGTYLFEATPDGTKVTARVELEPIGLTRLAGPLIAASLRREIATGLPVLKELLERQVAWDPA